MIHDCLYMIDEPQETYTVLSKSNANLGEVHYSLNFTFRVKFGSLDVHTRQSSKLAPLPHGGRRKSMKLMCKIFDLLYREDKNLKWDNGCLEIECQWKLTLRKNVEIRWTFHIHGDFHIFHIE